MRRAVFSGFTLRKFIPAATLVSLGWLSLAYAIQGPASFRPGFNLFSPAQDVQVGRENTGQVDKQLPILRDPTTQRYINDLGRRLSSYTPNNRSEYVWQFKVVNSPDINAFALPGGFIYVNRATIEAAQDEAQLAGVLAHEEGHVVMRHGTHQASEVMLAKLPLALLGGALGQSDNLINQVAELGLGLGMLKNSRSMEEQADQVGTYVLYRAGYDPRAMAQFFDVIERKYPQQAPQWLSDHPNPGNRIQAVNAEIPELGPPKPWKTNSPDFDSVKRRLLEMPPAPKPKPQQQTSSGG